MTFSRNFYKVFNIPENASDQQIDEAYKRLVSIYHSDKTGGTDVDVKYINHIRDVLKNPKSRAAHDAYLSGLMNRRRNQSFVSDNNDLNYQAKLNSLLMTIKNQKYQIQKNEDELLILKNRLKRFEDLSKGNVPNNDPRKDEQKNDITKKKETKNEDEKKVSGFGCFLSLGLTLVILGFTLLILYSLGII